MLLHGIKWYFLYVDDEYDVIFLSGKHQLIEKMKMSCWICHAGYVGFEHFKDILFRKHIQFLAALLILVEIANWPAYIIVTRKW